MLSRLLLGLLPLVGSALAQSSSYVDPDNGFVATSIIILLIDPKIPLQDSVYGIL
jgi:hypothetical protein